jgi:hypothetical protein
MINRFDKPAEYNPINTYVPIPFEEMMKVVDYRKKDKAFGEASALEMLGTKIGDTVDSFRIPGTGEIIDIRDAAGTTRAKEKVAQYHKQVQDLLATGADFSDTSKKMQLFSLMRNFQNDQNPDGDVGYATSNAQKISALQAELQKAPNLEQSPWRAKAIKDEILRWKANPGSELNTQGIGVSGYVDRGKAVSEIVQGINRELSDKGFQGRPVTEIGEDKIRQTFAGLAMNSDLMRDVKLEYQDRLGEATRNSKTPEELASNKAEAQGWLVTQIQQLEDGAVAKFRESGTVGGGGGGLGALSKFMSQYNDMNTQTDQSTPIAVAHNPLIKVPGNFAQKWATTTGDAKFNYMTGLEGLTSNENLTPEQLTAKLKNTPVEQVNTIRKNYREKFGIPETDMPNDQFDKMMNNAIGGLNLQGIALQNLSPEATKQNIPVILSQAGNRSFYVPDNDTGFVGGSDHKQKSTTFKGAADALGLTTDELTKKLSEAQGMAFVYDGPKPGMFQVTINGDHGPTNLLIGGDKGLEDLARPAQELSDHLRNMDDSPILVPPQEKDGKNYRYRRIVPVLSKDENGKVNPEGIFEHRIEDVVLDHTLTSKELKDSKVTGGLKFENTGLQLNDQFNQTFQGIANNHTIGYSFNYYTAPKQQDSPKPSLDPYTFALLMSAMQGGSQE